MNPHLTHDPRIKKLYEEVRDLPRAFALERIELALKAAVTRGRIRERNGR